jgi:hypothetical protein
VAYVAGLPNFLCTQVMQRSENRGEGWHPKDVLTVQLSYVDKVERYKLSAVNGRATKVTYRDMRGATSEGEFGSLLAEVFTPGNAKFRWVRESVIRDRAVYVFSYSVDEAKSQYRLLYGDTKIRNSQIVAAHHGFVYIDRQTGDILRLTQVADLPASFPIRNSVRTLDYAFSDVGGARYLLPLRAVTELGTTAVQTRNEVDFRDYRRFSADSSISFESQPDATERKQ